MSEPDDSYQSTRRGDLSSDPGAPDQSTRRGDDGRAPSPQSTRRGDNGLAPQSTRRADDAPLRRPADGVGAAAGSHLLQPGQHIDERYEVVSRFTSPTGEADVYRCCDLHEENDVVVKFYRPGIRPDLNVVNRLANQRNDNLVTLLDHGTWDGRFYEVQEYCAGGTAAEAAQQAPMNETSFRRLVEHAVAGLRVLHEMDLNHRDVKPSNIFYREAGRLTAVIGDYGIARAEISGVTSRAAGTHEYKAPEVFHGTFTDKSDYYALGVTLLALLRRGAPFQDEQGRLHRDDVIVDLKAREQIPVPADCPTSLAQLILGLTRYAAEPRWGHKQVRQWLRGEPVFMDNGQPDSDYRRGGISRHTYASDREIGTPVELATKLGRNFSRDNTYFQKVMGELFRGRITQWLADHWNTLSQVVEKIENEYTKDQALGTFVLRYTLDRQQPLEFTADLQARNFDEFVTVLERCVREEDTAPALALADLLVYSEASLPERSKLTCWLRATSRMDDTDRLIRDIDALNKRLEGKEPTLRLAALYHLISPRSPLRLAGVRQLLPDSVGSDRSLAETGSGRGLIEIRSPADIAEVLGHAATASETKSGLRLVGGLPAAGGDAADRAKVASSLWRMLYDGRLAEWLHYAFPDQPEHEVWVRRCVTVVYQKDKVLGFAALRWHFEPALGIEFNHEIITDPKVLAGQIDAAGSDGYAWAWAMLQNCVLRTWLVETGFGINAASLDKTVNEDNIDAYAKVESILHLLDPGMAHPVAVLSVGPEAATGTDLDLGEIPQHEARHVSLQVTNKGRGYLFGQIQVAGEGARFTGDTKVSGPSTTYVLEIRPRLLPVGGRKHVSVIVGSNGGSLRQVFYFTVTAPYGEMVRNCVIAGGIGAVLLGGLRWGLSLAHKAAEGWLFWVDFHSVFPPSGEHASYMFFGIPFLLVLLGFGYYLVTVAIRLQKSK